MSASALLAELEYDDEETLSLAWRPVDKSKVMCRRKVLVRNLDAAVAELPDRHDVYFAVNPTSPDPAARAIAANITRLAVLHAELDFKGDGTPENSTATIKALTEAFGPVKAIVRSGGGLHVYATVIDGHITEDVFTHADASALMKRFGALVTRIAATHGAVADPVFDVSRLFRVPGTQNWKYDPPRKVEALVIPDARGYTRADIAKRLDKAEELYPPPATPPRRPVTDVVTDADENHPFIAKALDEELAALADCPETGGKYGGRSNHSYRTAINLACWRQLNRDRLRELLTATATANGWADDPDADVDGTITRAFAYADTCEPRTVPAGNAEPLGHTDFGLLDLSEPKEVTTVGPDKYSHLPPDEQAYHRRFDALEAEIAPYAAKIFDGRPSLAPIRAAALRRTAAPLAVLASVLARVLVRTPPNIAIESGVALPCPPNLFVNLCGPPGSGKDLADAVAARLVPLGDAIPNIAPASGEAMASAFYMVAEDPDDEKKTITVRRNAIMVRVNEISALTKSAGRDGSILFPQLCNGFSGQKLGQERADKRKSFIVDQDSYRLSAIISAQPAMTDPLFAQQQGAAERWLWLPAASRSTTSAAAIEHQGASEAELPVPTFLDIVQGVQTSGELQVPDAVTADLRVDRDRQVAGLTPAIEAHGVQTRLRVMWGLTLLDGRVQPSVDDWAIAGHVMTISDVTREWCRQEAEKAALVLIAEKARRQGHADVERKGVVTDAFLEGANACGREVVRLLRDASGELTNRELNRRMSKPNRRYLRQALAALTADGVIEREPIGATRGGSWILQRDPEREAV